MKKSVLMVCLGNICRSPLAEGLLRAKLNPKTLEVDSAGTSDYHVDEAPDPRMTATAAQYNIDISDLRGRQFTVRDFDDFDHIYVMDRSNYNNVIRLARNAADKDKVSLILNEIFPSENREVPDPYYGGQKGFEEVFRLLDEATEVILKKLG